MIVKLQSRSRSASAVVCVHIARALCACCAVRGHREAQNSVACAGELRTPTACSIPPTQALQQLHRETLSSFSKAQHSIITQHMMSNNNLLVASNRSSSEDNLSRCPTDEKAFLISRTGEGSSAGYRSRQILWTLQYAIYRIVCKYEYA
jgi:hypothetical protein